MLQPENRHRPERVPVPGGYIDQEPGEDYDAFCRRADRLRLEAAEQARLSQDAAAGVHWRAQMARCFDGGLSARHRSRPGAENGGRP